MQDNNTNISQDLSEEQNLPQKKSNSENSESKTELTAKYFEDRSVDDLGRRRSWIGNLFFVTVIVLSLLLMYQLSRNAANGNEKTLREIIDNLHVEYLVVAVATVIVMIFIDSMKYFLILHATVNKRNYGWALKVGLLGKYYDNITPFSSGGQPFQIHYLYKKGLTGGESTAVIFIKYCFNMLMWLAICFSLMVFNRKALTIYVTNATQRTWFTALGWVGFVLNCTLPIIIIAFAVFPKIMEALARWFLTIGQKLKLVKSKDAIVLRAKRVAKDFRSAFVLMWKRPLHAVLLILCCITEPFLGMALPYFVVVAFSGSAVVPGWELMFAIMTLNVYVSMSVSVVPTPGNSGAMENAFLLILTSVAEGVLFWTVLTWRFMSYYTYVIIGMIIVIVDFAKKHRAAKTL